MTIGIDIRSINGGYRTGIERYVEGVLTGLRDLHESDNGSSKYLLWSTGVNMHEIPIGFSLTDHKPFQRVHVHIPNKILTLGWSVGGRPSLQKLFSNIDCMWLPNIGMYPYRASVPYTITVHDLSFLHYPHWYSLKRRLWHRLLRIRDLLQHARSIAAVSKSTADAVQEYFGADIMSKVVVIPPALPPAEVPIHVDFKNTPIVSQRFLLYVGTLEPRKNVTAVIRAFKVIRDSYADLQLVILGRFGWRAHSVIAAIRKDPRIIWLRDADDALKNHLYKRAAVFLWPSFYEGFGFPPLEALSHHTPVITSYRTSLPEIAGDHAIYCNPYAVDELIAALREVLAAEKLPFQLRSLPDAYASRTWKDVASEYLSILY